MNRRQRWNTSARKYRSSVKTLRVGVGEAAVKSRQQGLVVGRQRAGVAIGLQALADMLDRPIRLPVVIGHGAEDMGEEV